MESKKIKKEPLNWQFILFFGGIILFWAIVVFLLFKFRHGI